MVDQSNSTVGPHERRLFVLLFLSQVLKYMLFKSNGHLTSSIASTSVNFVIVAADPGAWSWWTEYPLG
jgi:hypothetical protein